MLANLQRRRHGRRSLVTRDHVHWPARLLREGRRGRVLWTYDGTQIAARAVRHDGDAARLYAWWHTESGYLR